MADQPMSEQPPVNIPGVSNNPAAMQQFVQMMMARMRGLPGSQQRAANVSPGMPGAVLPAPMPPTMAGGPAGSGGTQPPATRPQAGPRGLPGVSPTALASAGPQSPPMPSTSMMQNSYRTSGEKSAAITQAALANLQQSVGQIKMERFQKEAAKTEQAVSGYVTLLQKADEEQDPQKKQDLMRLAEQLKGDKDVAKLLEKAQKDPMSGAGVGLQRAMQMAIQKQQQQGELAKVYAEAQAKMEEAKKYQADAQKAQAEAAKAAQETANLTPEALQRKHEQDMEKTKAVEAAKTERVKEQVKGAAERNKNSVNGLVKAAQIRADAMERVAGIKTLGKGQKQVVDYLDKEYKNLQGRINDLSKQHIALQAHLDKQGLIGGWWNSDDVQVTRGKMDAIEAQSKQLQAQMDELDRHRMAALQIGALPADPTPQDETVVINPEDINAPDQPITVNPEDMPK